MFVYLDNSATTKQYEEVNESILQMMKFDFGNPSSLHRLGINAEKAVKEARKNIAQSIGANNDEIFFTSCGTESDNMALFGVSEARKRRGNKIIVSEIEHPAVLEPCKKLDKMGFNIQYIGVDTKGFVNINALEEAIDDKTILVSVMHVNNEVGSIQSLDKIKELINNYNKKSGTEILFHTDAVQSYGKLPVQTSYADLITLSGHKIHGPKGIGVLYIKKGINIEPYIYGGMQERGMRSGTENVPAIAGIGKASEICCKSLKTRYNTMTNVKKYLLEGIKNEIPDIKVNSPYENCISSVLNISFLGVRGEVLLHTLENSDIYVSTGSACSSNKKANSHVLRAMGLSDKEIEGAVRFSFSEFNTIEEMDYVLHHLKKGVSQFRKLGSFR
ncbi:cysteine desulfurase family protein [Anaerovorax odorimutans]|uniref:cysteine desulfurase family protein n=1 Tax=Anaerovorax odorimutans TaxID=109327 RepID=UPI0004102FF6|nr:cysteine desulfurase family protein [Anaerovorax odorimutans]